MFFSKKGNCCDVIVVLGPVKSGVRLIILSHDISVVVNKILDDLQMVIHGGTDQSRPAQPVLSVDVSVTLNQKLDRFQSSFGSSRVEAL